MDDEPGDADVEYICRWAANVGLLGRSVAIAVRPGPPTRSCTTSPSSKGSAEPSLTLSSSTRWGVGGDAP